VRIVTVRAVWRCSAAHRLQWVGPSSRTAAQPRSLSMTPLLTLCVGMLCCDAPGPNGEAIMAATQLLGRTMAERGIELVYGGGSVGVMGAISQSVDAAGGRVWGIIPKASAAGVTAALRTRAADCAQPGVCV
jgi:hypothetical protein